MSLNLEMDEQPAESRFFSSDDKTTGDNEGDQVNGGLDDDDVDSEGGDQKCLTLRLLQRCLPWFQTKSVWEPSQGDLFKTQVVQEVKYPAVLVLLERPFCEFVFVFSSIFSILLLLFSEGFLLESRILWGVIHCNNFVYTFCVFGAWLEILVKAKYAKTKQGFNSSDTLFSLLGVIPIDIVILVIHILNDNDADVTNPVTPWITVSRLLYVFRLRNVFLYFAKWEDQLAYSGPTLI
ncbi:hypothetical protein Fcan01_21385 [Folsomia candida]|uniref:Uncharacterized protein n=1 Tax=Folsomia candida TaxID=158441 RepID=A0A226DE29_FOLCA|nr:hypothetical protein Fcan01_21385 [Folsomia candida]